MSIHEVHNKIQDLSPSWLNNKIMEGVFIKFVSVVDI